MQDQGCCAQMDLMWDRGHCARPAALGMMTSCDLGDPRAATPVGAHGRGLVMGTELGCSPRMSGRGFQRGITQRHHKIHPPRPQHPQFPHTHPSLTWLHAEAPVRRNSAPIHAFPTPVISLKHPGGDTR